MPLNVLANGNYGLQSDQITYIHLTAFAAGGGMVPTPTGDVDTVASSGTFAASLTFAVTTFPANAPAPLPGEPAVSATPLVAESDAGNAGGGIGLVITDSAGLPQAVTKLFDIVRDVTAQSVGLDSTTTFTVAQPVPTATGP